MLKLKELRIAKGITQQEVAAVLGISRAAYTNIENGKREADYHTLKCLSDYFEKPIDYLLGKEDRLAPSSAKDDAPAEVSALLDYIMSREGLMFEGVPLSDEDRKMVADAIEIGLQVAMQKKKDKL